jgi:hypothetical protein
MADCQIRPFLLEVLKNEPAMAAVRLRLAAEQDGGNRKDSAIQPFFNLSGGHQIEKPALVLLPAGSALFVIVQHLFGGSEQRLVGVFGGANFTEKIREVITLGEPCELGSILQTHVKQAAYPGIP